VTGNVRALVEKPTFFRPCTANSARISSIRFVDLFFKDQSQLRFDGRHCFCTRRGSTVFRTFFGAYNLPVLDLAESINFYPWKIIPHFQNSFVFFRQEKTGIINNYPKSL